MKYGAGFGIIWLSSLLLVRAFTVTPESSPDASKSTWQWYFDQLRFVRGKVYDVCDVLPKLLRNVSSIYGVRLVTCRQQPWDQPSDSRTTADLFFDGTHFDQNQYTKPCLDKIAGELQHILHVNLTKSQLGEKTKLFTVTVQPDTVDVYVVRNKMDATISFLPCYPKLPDIPGLIVGGKPTLGVEFCNSTFRSLVNRRQEQDSWNHKEQKELDLAGFCRWVVNFRPVMQLAELINRRISAIKEVELLVVETDQVQVSIFGFKILLNVFLKKASIAEMNARDVYSSLDRIHSVKEKDQDPEDSDPSLEIIEIGNYLNMLTHACTTFKSDGIQSKYLVENCSTQVGCGRAFLQGHVVFNRLGELVCCQPGQVTSLKGPYSNR
ncbi:hypothetical protein CSKR_100693 [Clonorchis sinensis]|uniref:Uncharacterized protein n=1 Tax=Clonorchis sinensis TaxID=79923 RepID=A0A8T1LXH1_CLOSI|nr:hypothetical protein CSKR_100693 [Clonorchis sinensis]